MPPSHPHNSTRTGYSIPLYRTLWQPTASPLSSSLHYFSLTRPLGYLPYNTSFYRKHLVLPAAWAGTRVELYVEGALSASQWWLNGAPLASGHTFTTGYTALIMRLDDIPGIVFGAPNVLVGFIDGTRKTGWWCVRVGGRTSRNMSARVCGGHTSMSASWWEKHSPFPFLFHILPPLFHSKFPPPSLPPSLPPVPRRRYEGAGLYRRVRVTSANLGGSIVTHGVAAPANVTGAITPHAGSSASGLTAPAAVFPSVVLRNDGAASTILTATFVLRDAAGVTVAMGSAPAVTVPAGGANVSTGGTTTLSVPSAELWSVGRPYLYSLDTFVKDGTGAPVDATTVTVGIRAPVFDADRGFLLNGQSVKMRGFCNHENFGAIGVGGRGW